jgi:hypothetical protein
MDYKEPGFYGLLCLIAIGLILISAMTGCAPQPAMTSFQATCAVVPIGKNEQGITFLKQYCEIE